ncbi:MAG: AAA family ATPase [Prevotellaceae bacterium]|jgi:predicted AAA+ superfamily ATPase|nr:AAA family ATPase [Prevotellaceae bacterium]
MEIESLYTAFYRQLQETDTQFIRYLYHKISWKGRLIAITGARGAGKSTLLLQYIKLNYDKIKKNALYVSLDNIWFTTNRLYDLGEEFVKQGGEALFLDEVHKYPEWAREIKNLYDSFPSLKIVFTGSSMLEIYKGNADLSRRAVHYQLHGLSFREYLLFEKKIDFPALSLDELLENHIEIAQNINEKIKPLPIFQKYIKAGYYPYFIEGEAIYPLKLMNVINVVLEMDLPSLEKIEIYSIHKIKKLLSILSKMVPFSPNVTSLSAQIEVSRNSLMNYLHILDKAHIINMLTSYSNGLKTLTKPEKIYLNNTNLIFAFANDKPDIGNLRETFFFNQLKAVSCVTSSQKTDFTIDGKYQFEVGGKNKGHEQIIGLPNAYLALDNIEYGFGNKIPLWLFGFLY